MTPTTDQTERSLIPLPVAVILSATLVGLGALGVPTWVMALITAVGAAVTCTASLARSAIARTFGWRALALGSGLWSVVMVLTASASLAGIDPPSATVALGAVSGLAFLVAVVALLSFGDLRRNGLMVLDAVVAALSLALGALVLTGNADLSLPAEVLLTPTIDLFVLALVGAAFIYQPGRQLPRYVALGLVLSTVSDSLATVDTSGQPAPLNLGLLAGSAWMVAAGALAVDPPERPAWTRPPRRLSLLLMVGPALAVLAVHVGRHGHLEPLLAWLVILLCASLAGDFLIAAAELRHAAGESERTAARLVTEERRRSLAMDSAPVGMAVVDRDGALVSANVALAEIVQVPPEDLVGRRTSEFLLEPASTEPRLAVAAGLMAGYGGVVAMRRADGEVRMVEFSGTSYPSEEQDGLTFVTVQDVTERLEHVERLHHLASHDGLTGLLNRQSFSERLAVLLAEDAVGTLVVCDLDQFKVINDTLGHDCGDQLLRAVAERLAALEAPVVSARIGGDEFCVLFPGIPGARALERVSTALSDPYELGSEGHAERLHLTASVGGTTLRPGTDPERLVAEADAAMYRAKARGPGRRELFTSETRDSLLGRQQLVGALHRALDEDQFALWYQPIAEAATGTTVAFEALVRWNHPERGVLTPDHFLDVAESSGIMRRIDEHGMCRALERFGADGADGPAITINVSANEIVDPEFPGVVATRIAASGIDPARVWLELTETALMQDVRAATRSCEELKDLGLRLSLDDFGTGYSSLSYLEMFPIDTIKIDRRFVGAVAPDGAASPTWDRRRRPDEVDETERRGPNQGELIVRALVSLAESLELSCVAEGVETQEQLDFLRRLGCPLVQGYLIGRPRPEPTAGRVPGHRTASAATQMSEPASPTAP